MAKVIWYDPLKESVNRGRSSRVFLDEHLFVSGRNYVTDESYKVLSGVSSFTDRMESGVFSVVVDNISENDGEVFEIDPSIMNVKEINALISLENSTEVLEDLLEREGNGKARQVVLASLRKKLFQIKQGVE